ncbi:hypothetical protein EDC04DRAFT_3090992 [Pisolithus marmoratus]|nr:hypothetical protein EDC04DRAFT_3090992 [Pisolithus marmoratus]
MDWIWRWNFARYFMALVHEAKEFGTAKVAFETHIRWERLLMPPNSDSNTAGMLYISGVVAHTLYVGRFTPVGLISQTDLTALTGRVPPKQGTRFMLSSGLSNPGLIPRARFVVLNFYWLTVPDENEAPAELDFDFCVSQQLILFTLPKQNKVQTDSELFQGKLRQTRDEVIIQRRFQFGVAHGDGRQRYTQFEPGWDVSGRHHGYYARAQNPPRRQLESDRRKSCNPNFIPILGE